MCSFFTIIIIKCKVSFSSHSSSSHYSMQGFIFISFHFFFFYVNKWSNFYMQACFLLPFQNRCDQNVGTWWCRLLLAHLTTLFMVVKKSVLQILSAGLVWDVIELPSVVFSVCHNLYQTLVFCWHVYDRCSNNKFINWYPDMTIWILVQSMYSIFDRKEFELLSYRRAFLESTKICGSKETNGLE